MRTCCPPRPPHGWVLAIVLGLSLGIGSPASHAGVTCDGTDDTATALNESVYRFESTTPTSWTVELWASFTTASTARIFLKNSSNTTGGWSILATSSHHIECDLWTTTSPATATRFSANATINDGVPHHIACVFTGDSDTLANNDIQVYIDGALDQGALTRTGAAYAAGTAAVAACSRGGLNFLGGTIADLRITAEALSAPAIANHAASRLYFPSNPAVVVGYWPLDTCPTGSTVNNVGQPDRSGQGSTLTFSDGANNTGVTCAMPLSLHYPTGVQ